MKNEFKLLVREAFNTAYLTYKNNKLEEGAKEKGEELDRLDPTLKSKADVALNQVIKNPDLAIKYKWSPQGGGGLSTPQLNYLIDSLFELYISTKDEKYKRALSYIYSPFSEGTARLSTDPNTRTKKRITGNALHDILQDKLLKSTPLEQLVENDPEIFEELLTKSWGRMFAGGKISPGHRNLKNPPVDYFEHMISLYKDTGSSNFGAMIEQMLLNDVRNLIRSVARTKGITASIDKPKQSTGKSTDLGDPGDEYEALQSKYGSEISGSEFEDLAGGNPEGKSMTFTKANFNEAIREIIDTARAEGIKNEAALITLEELAINHLSYAEIAEKYSEMLGGRKPSDLLRDLVFKNRKFQMIADAIMEKHNLPSLTTADFQWIFKHGKESAREPEQVTTPGNSEEMDDSADYVWEEFVAQNMDTIMERVYKRLSKTIND